MASTITVPVNNLVGSQAALDATIQVATAAKVDINALQARATSLEAGPTRGTVLLVSGTATISATLTSTSRILVTMKTPIGTTLTTGYIARDSARNIGASTFTIEAIVAAGTINVADGSTVDWAVF